MNTSVTPIQFPRKNSNSPFSGMRAGHVGVWTADYEALINWYTEKLDFRLLVKHTAGDLKLAFLAPANDDQFWLEILSDGAANASQTSTRPINTGFQHLCLDVDHVDETLTVLISRGVKLVREPFNVPSIGRRCGFILDLDDNVIELMETIY